MPRNGFTLVEMMISVMIMSILLAMGVPRMFKIRDQGAVRSAKQQVAAYLATARAAAIRRGRTAQFRRSGDVIWVTTTGGASIDTVARPIPLGDAFSITLSGGVDSIVFDSRGFATNLVGTQTFKVTRSDFADSVCVSRGGLIAKRCGI